MSNQMTRRDVVKAGAVGAAAMLTPMAAARLNRNADDVLRVGVIGCGGRGTGAAVNALEADPATRIVAAADLFEDRLTGSLSRLEGHEQFGSRVDVPMERRFVGFDGYKKLLAIDELDYVILATPPGFRPAQIEAAVRAGKHVFSEKPVAVDPVGARRVMGAGRLADEKGLSFAAGTQRRHQNSYREMMARVEDGAIGDVVAASCYWNMGTLWSKDRMPGMSDMEWQCRNWLYFCWLSGDHICEQHIHNIDVVNWAKGGPPVKAMGMGGREVRTDPKFGNIFDHHAIEFEYEDGTPMLSMCRQTAGCATRVDERLIGTKGRTISSSRSAMIQGEHKWRFRDEEPSPYMLEHRHLIASIRGQSSRLNEAVRVSESTMTAIMGRMSTYTGKAVTWDHVMSSTLDLSPASLEFGPLPVRPVAVPGTTELV